MVQSTNVQMNILNLAQIGGMPVGAKKGMVLLVLDHRGHFVLVEPLRPKRRTSGGGVKKCMTYCTDVVSEDKVHGDPSIPCIVV